MIWDWAMLSTIVLHFVCKRSGTHLLEIHLQTFDYYSLFLLDRFLYGLINIGRRNAYDLVASNYKFSNSLKPVTDLQFFSSLPSSQFSC